MKNDRIKHTLAQVDLQQNFLFHRCLFPQPSPIVTLHFKAAIRLVAWPSYTAWAPEMERSAEESR